LVPVERQQEILRRVAVERIVKVKRLAADLGVHEMTIRRDLDLLAEQGLVDRVHGGARIRNQAAVESSYQNRISAQLREKELMARSAAELVRDGDTVAFDASTSSLAVIRKLAARSVSAIVVSLDAAEAAASSGIPFIMIGGIFHAPARSFVGPQVAIQLERLHPDKVFFSAKGFSRRAGFTDAHLPEVETKERLVRSAGVVVSLLDRTKFGREALGTIATPAEVDILITDREPSLEYVESLEAAGVRLVVAEDRE
jgi:DeoR family fructose operon transcriptional repressor